MKRSAAPSHTSSSSTSKKMKPSKGNDKSSNRNDPSPLPLIIKSVAPPPIINTKQQKAFHFLVSAASYISVLEGSTDSAEGVQKLIYRYYHGYDDDNIGVVENFLQGNGRFGVLWDDGRIIYGLGHLSGLTQAQLRYYVPLPTLSGKFPMNGRQILEKARLCLLEAKKLLALWMEFCVDGKLPSGMNEENALQYVLKKAHSLTSNEVVGDDEVADPINEGEMRQFIPLICLSMSLNILFNILMFLISPLI